MSAPAYFDPDSFFQAAAHARKTAYHQTYSALARNAMLDMAALAADCAARSAVPSDLPVDHSQFQAAWLFSETRKPEDTARLGASHKTLALRHWARLWNRCAAKARSPLPHSSHEGATEAASWAASLRSAYESLSTAARMYRTVSRPDFCIPDDRPDRTGCCTAHTVRHSLLNSARLFTAAWRQDRYSFRLSDFPACYPAAIVPKFPILVDAYRSAEYLCPPIGPRCGSYDVLSRVTRSAYWISGSLHGYSEQLRALHISNPCPAAAAKSVLDCVDSLEETFSPVALADVSMCAQDAAITLYAERP